MNLRFPKRFTTGLFFGATIAFGFSAIIDNQVGNTLRDEWTTLAIVATTIFAARLALTGPQAQIEQQYEFAKQREHARRTASRALLPIIASDIHLISSTAIQLSFQPDGFFREMSNKKDALAQLELSHTTIERISRCLETARPNESTMLQLVAAQHQICYARTRKIFAENYTNSHHRLSVKNAVDWAFLKGLSDHLYKLGRLDIDDLDSYLEIEKFKFRETPKNGKVDWNLIDTIDEELSAFAQEFAETKIVDLKKQIFGIHY